ncbi:unnamed protein product [Phyllotreta striolata]|uniref:Zinc/iron permease n=1 Tax=Phyllotreta striolata TaxID=444603 RepID=A0A9N9TIV3_PHYSR|nr:unnamed protein product [Phyllotreta striolata]
MNLLTTKILVAVLFFFIRFFFGILPVKIYNVLRAWEGDDDSGHFINQKRHHQVNVAIALCQSFGGGVLFATCFLHMMLEVQKSMEDLKKFGLLNIDYPLSQLAICLGFFLVYFMEEISHWAITRIPDKKNEVSNKKLFNNITNASVTPLNGDLKPVKAFIVEEEFEKAMNNEEDKESSLITDEIVGNSMKTKVLSIDNQHENIVYDSLSFNSEEVVYHNQKNLEIMENLEKQNVEKIDDSVISAEEAPEEELMEEEIKSKQQIMRGCLVILALSFHAVFEGLAIGLQKEAGNIWYLFIAVCIHSATILFCISLEMVLAKVKSKAIILHSLGLAISSPLGVTLGILVTLDDNVETKGRSTAVVLLEGLSAGTILYITFFEVLNREKERRSWRISRAICILSGFGLMAVLQWYR